MKFIGNSKSTLAERRRQQDLRCAGQVLEDGAYRPRIRARSREAPFFVRSWDTRQPYPLFFVLAHPASP